MRDNCHAGVSISAMRVVLPQDRNSRNQAILKAFLWIVQRELKNIYYTPNAIQNPGSLLAIY